jgi:cyclophilin family peptidyl-prolyl cis-trans isomerase
MIQGGGVTAEMHEKNAKAPIKNEAGNGLKNLRGTIAMARTTDVDSATCQFFINHKDNAFLDHKNDTPDGFGYCVFGKVVAGTDVVDAIAKVKTGTRRGMENVPLETVTILSVEVIGGK